MNVLGSYKIAIASALIFASGTAFAQSSSTTDPSMTGGTLGAVNKNWQPSLVKDGVYDRVAHINQPLAWQPIREADVLWKKRVWREIDTREKQNMAFRYPGDENTGGGMFIEILIDAIKKGKVKAYSNFDDRFTTALTKDQLNELIMGKPDTSMVEDPATGQMTMKIIQHEFNPDLITKFHVKEDWIFDRNEGRIVRRIIGLAPYRDILNDDGTYRTSVAMFWLHYPEIRSLLAQYEVFNPENDVDRMNWDEFFEGGHFGSRIIKVSNPFDATFKEAGMSNMEALYEGQKVQEEIFNKEHDMWVY